jgi:hypothetical protein
MFDLADIRAVEKDHVHRASGEARLRIAIGDAFGS